MNTTAQITKLTNKAIAAHAAYRTARAANLNPIQSPREVKANAKYTTLKAELEAACQAAGVPTPKTWNVY